MPDPTGTALWVRLSGIVTMADLNARAAAMACEGMVDALDPGSRVYVNLTGLEGVEVEARGVLIYLLQRALRRPGIEVHAVVPPPLQRALGASPVGRLLSEPRVRVFQRLTALQRGAD